MKTFGETLKVARLERRLTLVQVAKACKTHKGYISGIERGNVNAPSAKVVARLCKYLDLDYQRMLAMGWWEKRPKALTLEAAVGFLNQAILAREAAQQPAALPPLQIDPHTKAAV